MNDPSSWQARHLAALEAFQEAETGEQCRAAVNALEALDREVEGMSDYGHEMDRAEREYQAASRKAEEAAAEARAAFARLNQQREIDARNVASMRLDAAYGAFSSALSDCRGMPIFEIKTSRLRDALQRAFEAMKGAEL